MQEKIGKGVLFKSSLFNFLCLLFFGSGGIISFKTLLLVFVGVICGSFMSIELISE